MMDMMTVIFSSFWVYLLLSRQSGSVTTGRYQQVLHIGISIHPYGVAGDWSRQLWCVHYALFDTLFIPAFMQCPAGVTCRGFPVVIVTIPETMQMS
ncbi:uncharacterized protein F4822DRAFT_393241 [Hypoxylon trugodes]|uniref:uncharacterized protein n=1 Tax=Hypoxylon trugodes TaxID=326681 RepID=UPI002194A718|nr:uncharacterized protein F4822DRAFT_393241 [Hypoxylon trugodes]KAI1390468.1 hypothetical protein F4822DRAFT_393241 [Hypoxylon trugodes]